MNKRGLKCNERAKAIRLREVKQQEQRKFGYNTFIERLLCTMKKIDNVPYVKLA